MADRAQPFKDHWKEQRLFLSRVIAAAVIVFVLAGVLVGRLVQLQIVDHQRFSELSQGNRLRIEPLAPTRGLIMDRNGLIVAENLPTWQLVAIPEQIENLDATMTALEELELLEPGSRESLVDLIRSHRGFERVALRNLSEAEAARFAVRRHRYPGIDIQAGLVRYYPFGGASAHAVGYVGSISTADLEDIDRSDYAATSQVGKTGVERSYEDVLHGSVGYRQQVVNAQGRVLLDPVREAGQSRNLAGQGGLETRWPTPGNNVVLSLDMRVQLASREALGKVRGAVVAIDPRNGDVLALVSTPSFDPNRFAAGLSRADFVALNSDPSKPLFNRALAGSYPPGSTVKPLFGLASLHHESIDPFHEVYCGGHFSLPNSTHRYRDWRAHGPMRLHTAIIQSCDVYFYRAAVELGIDRMEAFLSSFGFGAKTGIDISGENRGLVPSREWKRTRFSRREDQVWFPGETVIAGIGQGFTQVTPVQLAHAGASMAAQGTRFRPRLMIGAEDPVSREVEWAPPVALPAVEGIDEAHWDMIEAAMVGVTSEVGGSALSAMRGTPYTVAGKTGSAQVFTIAQEEEYDEDEVEEHLRDHGLFFAYAPVEAPRIALAVVVENGGGSRAATPIARKVLDAFFEAEEYVARER